MYLGSVDMLAAATGGDADTFAGLLEAARAETAPVTIANLDEQRAQLTQKWTAFLAGIGFLVFISGMLIITLAMIFYEDRENHTFARVQATNVSAISYVAGICAAGFVAIILMVVLFLSYCALSGIGKVIALVPVALLCVLFVLFCVGFALICGLLLNSRNAIIWVAIVSSTFLSLLGGASFPISYAPDYLQKLAHVTPQFWIIDAIYRMHDGESDAWILSAVILALFGLLCFLIAGIRFANNRSRTRM
jgi:ABC-2 type transport system permease protein